VVEPEYEGKQKQGTPSVGARVAAGLGASSTAEETNAVSEKREPDPDEPDARESVPATFPLAALPPSLQRFIREAADALPCPPDLIGVPLLALAGAAIGNSRHLKIKNEWIERPILWGVIVAPPGAKKTPALKLVRKPWEARQRKLIEQSAKELEEWDARKRGAEQQQKSTADGEPSACQPLPRQAYISDTTMEALSDVLGANPRGVALICDELDGWVVSMNQYKQGRGNDRKHWLSLWSGEPIQVNRRIRKVPTYVAEPFVGVVGGIQPDLLEDLSDERGRRDGFIHRCLFAYPEPLPISPYTEAEVSWDVQASYSEVIERLWTLTPEADEGGCPQPALLHLTPAAKRCWIRWHDEHVAEQNAPAFPAALGGPWQKIVSAAARLALIVHSLRWAAGEHVGHDVDEQSMAAAAALAEYFKSHARRVYMELHMSEDDKRLMAALEWIRRQPGGTTTARGLQHANVGGVKSADEARALLHRLADDGHGVIQEGTGARGGRTSIRFTLR
jgi:hypothetical protein